MAMTPSAKKKLGLLSVALVALAIDRGLIFSGGSDANAQATQGPASATTPSSSQQANGKASPTIEIAGVLETLRQAVAQEEPPRDAFRLPDILAPQPEVDSTPIPVSAGDRGQQPQPESPPQDIPAFDLTSIIAASTNDPIAVINGTPIRVGQTRNEITLVSVTTRSATIRYADRLFQIKLNSDH
ncbi:MAG: hypothetical protein ACIAQF_12425 [Phycisphaerales bacterium JB065]